MKRTTITLLLSIIATACGSTPFASKPSIDRSQRQSDATSADGTTEESASSGMVDPEGAISEGRVQEPAEGAADSVVNTTTSQGGENQSDDENTAASTPAQENPPLAVNEKSPCDKGIDQAMAEGYFHAIAIEYINTSNDVGCAFGLFKIKGNSVWYFAGSVAEVSAPDMTTYRGFNVDIKAGTVSKMRFRAQTSAADTDMPDCKFTGASGDSLTSTSEARIYDCKSEFLNIGWFDLSKKGTFGEAFESVPFFTIMSQPADTDSGFSPIAAAFFINQR